MESSSNKEACKHSSSIKTHAEDHTYCKSTIIQAGCQCDNTSLAAYCGIPLNTSTFTTQKQFRSGKFSANAAINNILSKDGRVPLNVLGDGNCFFRCLSLYFFGTEQAHACFRNAIVNFICIHIQFFGKHISQAITGYTIEEYISKMRLTTGLRHSWATEIEIEAAATMLQMPVYLLSKWGIADDYAWQKFKPAFATNPSFGFQASSFIAIISDANHYMLASLSACVCNCQCRPPVLMHSDTADPAPVGDQQCIVIDADQSTATETSEPLPKRIKIDTATLSMTCTSRVTTNKKAKNIGQEAFLNSIMEQPNHICSCCSKLFYNSSVSIYDVRPTWARIMGLSVNIDKVKLCSRCFNSLKQNKMPPLCMINNLHTVPIPVQLQCLNVAEQKIISLAHVYMKVVILPYGQKAINGQVINFPYDVQDQVNVFKHQGLVLVRVEGNKDDIPKEYKVDTHKVTEALKWLKSNNHLYRHINIPVFDTDVSVPPTITIDSNDKINTVITISTARTENALLTESSVVCKDPVMPKIDYSKFVDDRNVPIYNIHRNTQAPVNMFTHDLVEQMAFPVLFPNGINGLRAKRTVKLTTLQYFQSRLMSSDPRWQKKLSYLFWATNLTEKEQLMNGISIANRIRRSKRRNTDVPLTLGQVRANFGHNPDYPEHFYGFMKSIRGSAAYWNGAQLDLLAMINTRGPMTWFLTVSANDMNWDDLMCILCSQAGLPNTVDDLRKMSKSKKSALMVANPVTTARHFCRRVHHLIHSYILSDEMPLGKVVDYFWRIEFQMRGSPHLHSVWWIENAPNLDTVEGRKIAPAFIDKYVSTELPADDMMRKRVQALQVHSHTQTCKKYNTGFDSCRFGYPQQLTDTTRLKTGDLLQTSAQSYVLKRRPGCENINPYNPDILRVWNANMDLQLVGCAIGAAKYVCSYICKRESDEVQHAIRDAVSKLPADASSKRQLSTIGNIFLTHRLLSTQEASFKMCGLPLRGSSRKVQFLNTRPEKERTRLLLPKAKMENLSEDCEEIFCSGVFDRYMMRPHSDEFQSMTLYNYCQWYDSSKQSKNSLELLNGSGFIHKRRQQKILRTPSMTVEKDGDGYYFSLLLLYLPWRNEKELVDGFGSAEEAFQQKHGFLKRPESFKHAEDIARAVKQIQALQDMVLNNYIAPIVAPNVEALDNDIPDSQNNIHDDPTSVNLLNVTDECQLDNTDICNAKADVFSGIEDDIEMNTLTFTRMTDEEYTQNIASLNDGQHDVFNCVKEYYIKLHNFHVKQQQQKPEPLRLFVSGSGGTGKSHVIGILRELVTRSSLHLLTHESPAVVLMAPTGVASFNIQGLTVHRALNLPIQHGASNAFKPLNGERLAILRRQWKNTSTVIIDEISMISYDTFHYIHQRLNEIMDCDGSVLFGGLNIIALGDLYQLPPVSPGHFIFAGGSAGCHLWRDQFSMLELTENMRQKGDMAFSDALLRIRTGEQTDADITLLETRVTNGVSPIDCAEEPFKSALYLFPKIKSCDNYNNFRLLTLPSRPVTYSIHARHAVVQLGKNKFRTILTDVVPPKLIPTDDRECAGLPAELHLCVGAVIMLRRNINTCDGLVNGARGIISGFIWHDGKSPSHVEDTWPKCLLVKFFDERVGRSTMAEYGNGDVVPIETLSAEFYGHAGSRLVRTQFPVQLSWAATIHKVQGLTLTHAVIDIGSDVFSPGMTYVALSRVTSLSGLALIGFDRTRIQCSALVQKEMKRLRLQKSIDSEA